MARRKRTSKGRAGGRAGSKYGRSGPSGARGGGLFGIIGRNGAIGMGGGVGRGDVPFTGLSSQGEGRFNPTSPTINPNLIPPGLTIGDLLQIDPHGQPFGPGGIWDPAPVPNSGGGGATIGIGGFPSGGGGGGGGGGSIGGLPGTTTNPYTRGGFTGTNGGTVGIQQSNPYGQPLGITSGGNFSNPLFKQQARDVRRIDPTQAFGNTIHVVPNGGNNNTPSEMNNAGPRWKDTHLTKSQNYAQIQNQKAQQQALQKGYGNSGAITTTQGTVSHAALDNAGTSSLNQSKGNAGSNNTVGKIVKQGGQGWQTGGGY